MHDLLAIDELQLGERHDAVLVEGRLEGEVEACECLDGGEPRHDEGCFDAAIFAQHQFLGEQRINGLDGGHLALLDPTQSDIEDFDGPRHLEPDQAFLDAIDEGWDDLDLRIHRTPPFASRRATAS